MHKKEESRTYMIPGAEKTLNSTQQFTTSRACQLINKKEMWYIYR